MRSTEPLQYLPQMGISPLQVRECALTGCTNVFQVINGVAFAGRAEGQTEVHMHFFCCYECYLSAIPLNCCGSA